MARKKSKGKKKAVISTSKAIGEHHALRKQIAQTTDPFLKARLLREEASAGGLSEYQATSVEGTQSGGETCTWSASVLLVYALCWFFCEWRLVKTLLRSNLKKPTKLLDVGAIAGTSYAEEDWIDATHCDLNPKGDHVIKSDFMDLPLPSAATEKYGIVCLSLVLNFEGDLAKRGDMLIHVHNFLKPKGSAYPFWPYHDSLLT
jgi:25S rRNA (adenine2142-N1)-methyltransferase